MAGLSKLTKKVVWFCNDKASFSNKARGLAVINKFVDGLGLSFLMVKYFIPVRKKRFGFVLKFIAFFCFVARWRVLAKAIVVYPVGTDVKTVVYYLTLFRLFGVKCIPYVVDNVFHPDCPAYDERFKLRLYSFERLYLVTKELCEYVVDDGYPGEVCLLEFPAVKPNAGRADFSAPFKEYVVYSGSLSKEYRGSLDLLVEALKIANSRKNAPVGLIITAGKAEVDYEFILNDSYCTEELYSVLCGAKCCFLLNSFGDRDLWHRSYSFPSKILMYGLAKRPVVCIAPSDAWVCRNLNGEKGVYFVNSAQVLADHLTVGFGSEFVTRKENKVEVFKEQVCKLQGVDS